MLDARIGHFKKHLKDQAQLNWITHFIWKIADDCVRDAFLIETATKMRAKLGEALFEDHNVFFDKLSDALKTLGIKLSASDHKLIVNAVSWHAEDAPRVISKLLKDAPDSELRDYEQIPLLEEGGIEAFTRHFYQPPRLRTLARISADILALEKETDGLLQEITKAATA